MKDQIDEANRNAVARILESEAVLVDLKPAIKAIPGYKRDLITHAGPPIEWDRMIKVQKFAIINAIRAEGLAETAQRAEKLARTGEVRIEPNHNYGNVSGMCGVTSASSPVLVFKDKVHGNVATDWMQTDLTSFGDKYERAIKEVEFVKKTLGPVMAATIKHAGGFNIKELLSKGITMGDELHGSFEACRGVLMNWILPHIVRTGFPKETLGKVGDYFMGNGGRWYCGNLMMGACKVMMDSAKGIKYSTIVTAMARNGVDFGIKVSALGDQWFTGRQERSRDSYFRVSQLQMARQTSVTARSRNPEDLEELRYPRLHLKRGSSEVGLTKQCSIHDPCKRFLSRKTRYSEFRTWTLSASPWGLTFARLWR